LEGGRFWYLDVDVFVEFKRYFVSCFGSLLHALNSNTRSSQVDLWMLEINCVDREIDYVLSFICLAAALCPENYAAISNNPQLNPTPGQKWERRSCKSGTRRGSRNKARDRDVRAYLLDGGFWTFCRQLTRDKDVRWQRKTAVRERRCVAWKRTEDGRKSVAIGIRARVRALRRSVICLVGRKGCKFRGSTAHTIARHV
jgi:hypothetical protein